MNTNVTSMQAQEYLRASSDFQAKTINRVTSGLRITSSGDDAAGLAIANSLRSDRAVLTQGVRNANDGLSTLQTIDGGINNISNLLDRARTLAAQSASGTFNGDRNVLDSEFQSVITEIDRQAKAIGLDQGGIFAKSMSVFIGGGRAHAGESSSEVISNGSVALDLSNSTVDASSLGLKGVQARGISGTNLGAGGGETSVVNVLSNDANEASLRTANFTEFVLRGPGFGDANGVKLSVGIHNIGSTSELVAQINSAISSASNGGTSAAAALKNANIKASVLTEDGKERLVFTSSTTAFQVEAGDRMANALMGNFERNAVATGSNTAAYIDTDTGAGGDDTFSVKFDGGSQINVTVATSDALAKGTIVKTLNDDSTFSANAIASLEGNQIVIRSKTNSSSSSIEIVDTGLSQALGLTAGSDVTFSAASASTGAEVKSSVQAASAVQGGASIVSSNNAATLTIDGTNDNLDITVGSSGAQTLSLAQGTSLTKQQIAADMNVKIAANINLNGKVSASVVDNQIVLTATNAGDTIATASTFNIAGFSASTTYSSNMFAKSDTIRLEFQGGGLAEPVTVELNATSAGATSVADVLSDLQSKIAANTSLSSAGITLTTAAAGNQLVFTNKSGERFQVAVSGDSQNKLGMGSFSYGTGSSLEYVELEGTAFTPTAAAFETGIAHPGSATLHISLNGGSTVALTASNVKDAYANVTGGLVSNSANLGTTASNVVFTHDGTDVTVALGGDMTLDALITALNADGGFNAVMVADKVVEGAGTQARLRVRSLASGEHTVTVSAATSAANLTAMNLTAGTTGQGHTNAQIQQDIVDKWNAAIAGNDPLRNAGLEASVTADKIKLASENGTQFRVSAAGTLDVGFGSGGASFAGNEVSAAPATSGLFSSEGADASEVLAWSDMSYGGDDQAVTITASDANGIKHSLAVTLRNDATARNAYTLDEAIQAINKQLQESNDSTLNRIVAVKTNDSGVEGIKFLSTVREFEVSIASQGPGGTGITTPAGNVMTAATDGTGSNSSIETLEGAKQAVSALASAVTALGAAQAVVGKGQNQFNFAVNLAQTQLNNLAAAESRIRDADLAAEAANLTKAQILQQAGVAALAQANSAPQTVLSLLRG
jgi:flagellin